MPLSGPRFKGFVRAYYPRAGAEPGIRLDRFLAEREEEEKGRSFKVGDAS
jgi:hypothetical protein